MERYLRMTAGAGRGSAGTWVPARAVRSAGPSSARTTAAGAVVVAAMMMMETIVVIVSVGMATWPRHHRNRRPGPVGHFRRSGCHCWWPSKPLPPSLPTTTKPPTTP